jgi:hypothetical protein
MQSLSLKNPIVTNSIPLQELDVWVGKQDTCSIEVECIFENSHVKNKANAEFKIVANRTTLMLYI